jgi:hypothetical protein
MVNHGLRMEQTTPFLYIFSLTCCGVSQQIIFVYCKREEPPSIDTCSLSIVMVIGNLGLKSSLL